MFESRLGWCLMPWGNLLASIPSSPSSWFCMILDSNASKSWTASKGDCFHAARRDRNRYDPSRPTMGTRLNKKSKRFTINMYLEKSRSLKDLFQHWSYALPQGVESHRTTESKDWKPGKTCTNNHWARWAMVKSQKKFIIDFLQRTSAEYDVLMLLPRIEDSYA